MTGPHQTRAVRVLVGLVFRSVWRQTKVVLTTLKVRAAPRAAWPSRSSLGGEGSV